MEKEFFQSNRTVAESNEPVRLNNSNEMDGLTPLHQTPFYLAQLDFSDNPNKAKPSHLNENKNNKISIDNNTKNQNLDILLNHQPKTWTNEIAKSTSLETIISQNDDLMARLKVTLRRLTVLENENEELKQEHQQTTRSYQALSDQILIWKEKEKQWKGRCQSLEQELTLLKQRFPELEKMEEKLHRFERYQEKVKTQIKPYIQQLKNYAESLHEQIKELNTEVESKDFKIQDLSRQNIFLSENFEVFKINFESQQARIIEEFEKEREYLLNEIKSALEQNTKLSEKADRLDKSLAKQDELENLVISLRRSKEEAQLKFDIELNELRSQISAIKMQNIESTIKIEDLSKEKESLEKQLMEAQLKSSSNDEQLVSIRYLWKQKSEEVEHLKMSLQSLEKINLDLSQSLRQLRTTPAQS